MSVRPTISYKMKNAPDCPITPSPEESRFPGASIPILLARTAQVLREAEQACIDQLGFDLNPEEFFIVRQIVQHNELTVSMLRSMTRRDRKHLFRVLARFEELGLIDRQQSANDRRSYLIHATKRCQRLHALIEPAILKLHRSLLNGFDGDSLLLLVDALHVIGGRAEGYSSNSLVAPHLAFMSAPDIKGDRAVKSIAP
jgi:DNA-binding MarR family transcriptional regulator